MGSRLDLESRLRSSERLAAIAVIAMTIPAFLAFPVLGMWYVTKVWPNLDRIDRGVFCCALVIFFVGVPYCFQRGMLRARQGHSGDLLPLEIAVITAPVLLGGWALSHRFYVLLFVGFLCLWDMYKAYRRQRENPSRKMNFY